MSVEKRVLPDWNRMCQEQTPADLRVDRSGRRAWGYKRIRLSMLMAFARKNRCSVSVRAPYVTMDPLKEADEDADHRQETSFTKMDDNEDEWDDDFDVPRDHAHRPVSRSIQDRLKMISPGRRERCIQIFKILSYIDHHKINFRLFNPRGERAGIKLVFQITNAVLTHEALKAIELFGFVKETTLRLNQGKVLTMKVVIT